jgi:hypothetical protein
MCRVSSRLRCVVSLLILIVAGLAPPCRGQAPACRDGDCEPHCPVRPGQFGYYQTQWRRWPTGGPPATAAAREPALPAPPPKAIVPDADEESPRGDRTAEPASATLPQAEVGRIDRLVEEADVVRLADERRRQDFTGRLVASMLTEPEPQARCVVLGLAADFDTPAAEAICAGALDDPDPRVRLTACQVCGDRRGPESVARLARRAREDADLGVRLRAVRVLGELGDAAAVPHLVAILDDPDPAIQSRAAAALARATGHDFGADVDRWRAWAAAPRHVPPPRWSLNAALRRLF